MNTLRLCIGQMLRRWRIARYQHRRLARQLKDERNAEHLQRLRQGIKDNTGFSNIGVF